MKLQKGQRFRFKSGMILEVCDDDIKEPRFVVRQQNAWKDFYLGYIETWSVMYTEESRNKAKIEYLQGQDNLYDYTK